MTKKASKGKDVQVEQDEARNRVGEFALLHLGFAAHAAGEMASLVLQNETAVDLLPFDEEHEKELALDEIVNLIDYCSAGLSDLRAVGLLPGGGNTGCSGTGGGEIGQPAQSSQRISGQERAD